MSQRVLIVGVSESGKTTLANRLIKDSPYPVYVRDPLRSQWSRNDGFFETEAELRKLHVTGAPCVVVVDEANDFFTKSTPENMWIFTRGRHMGMLPIAITHYVKMLQPVVRDQATDLYVFESSIQTAALLAEMYNQPALEDAPNLRQGEYLHVRREGRERVLSRHDEFIT